MLEAISTSDFHLEGMKKHFLDATNRQIKEVDKVHQYALSKGIKHVFWPGDLSDHPVMSFGTYMKLVMFIKKYDGLLNIYYVGGNHDRSDAENTSCDLLKLLAEHRFFKSFRIFLAPEQDRIEGTLVNFCAWPCNASMTEKEGCLNFAHIAANGAIGDNGRPMKVSHDFGSHKRDYTISGHIHQYQHLKKQKVIFNGNPYQKNFGESLPKGFIHFKTATKKNEVQMKHRFIDNHPNFELHTVVIESPSDFAKLKDSNNLRYKLLVAPDVLIPSDLRIQYPNITGGIFNSETKKQDKTMDNPTSPEQLGLVSQVARIKPTTGLTEFLVGEGYNKKAIKTAKSIVKEAMNELGIS
jgi:DNA repair exonuclease SbcCD nuclease subunit